MQNTQDSETLEKLTIDAVKALLRTIGSGTEKFPAYNESAVRGTYASFAADGLKSMLSCETINRIVSANLTEENPERYGRKSR